MIKYIIIFQLTYYTRNALNPVDKGACHFVKQQNSNMAAIYYM